MNSIQQLIQDDISFTQYRLSFPLDAALRQTLETKLAGLRQQLVEAGVREPRKAA